MKPAVHDGPVLLPDGVGECPHQVIPAAVILVGQADLDAGRRHDRHERLGRRVIGQRGLQVGDVALDRLRPVPDLAGDHRLGSAGAEEVAVLHVAEQGGVGVRPGVEAGELIAVAALAERRAGQGPVPALDAVQPVTDIPAPHRLPELAVIDDVDPGGYLAPHHVRDPGPELRQHRRCPLPLRGHRLRQFRWPLQGPDVRGEDPVNAPSHLLSPMTVTTLRSGEKDLRPNGRGSSEGTLPSRD